MSPSDSQNPYSHVIRPADLPGEGPHDITLVPDAAALSAIAADLGLDGLRKMRFQCQMQTLGKRDWRLTGRIGATVVQPCVVTLAPVTTRVEEDVERIWRAGLGRDDEETPHEMEMPDAVTEEPLTVEIDLGVVAVEALALALPLYPHAEGAVMAQAMFTEPGKQAMTDEEARPFASLAALRDKLGAEEEPESDE
ncbi:DUF177 domain-containing protein [Aliiroseovarius subalbicans]|uniref:YceD family protein n=1 Tax=Aliiroseovarius subalbicans TaxID=2925840 RepID=UPI001F5711DA|nr:DUF177 domain-containing protein [Aliiroseovarius subalbicans]MCI2398736.1 DUF177 domain-containing protein [Aliiroseovarius subalbicans]